MGCGTTSAVPYGQSAGRLTTKTVNQYCQVTGLRRGVLYDVTVQAQNADGVSLPAHYYLVAE